MNAAKLNLISLRFALLYTWDSLMVCQSHVLGSDPQKLLMQQRVSF